MAFSLFHTSAHTHREREIHTHKDERKWIPDWSEEKKYVEKKISLAIAGAHSNRSRNLNRKEKQNRPQHEIFSIYFIAPTWDSSLEYLINV